MQSLFFNYLLMFLPHFLFLVVNFINQLIVLIDCIFQWIYELRLLFLKHFDFLLALMCKINAMVCLINPFLFDFLKLFLISFKLLDLGLFTVRISCLCFHSRLYIIFLFGTVNIYHFLILVVHWFFDCKIVKDMIKFLLFNILLGLFPHHLIFLHLID